MSYLLSPVSNPLVRPRDVFFPGAETSTSKYVKCYNVDALCERLCVFCKRGAAQLLFKL